MPVTLVKPDRASIVVGLPRGDLLQQAPLLVALQSGYFDDVGFRDISLVETTSGLSDLQSGELEFAVVDALEAFETNLADPTLRAVAGYQNYDARDGAYGGSAVVAAPGLVADEPATASAFASAYIRALDDLSDADEAARSLARLKLSDETIAKWPDVAPAFEPFDGGFGSVDDGGGWGELGAYLSGPVGSPVAPEAMVAQHTLNIGQASRRLPSNPANELAGAPNITAISVGLPLADRPSSPIVRADETDFFTDAGFASVEIVDVEEPLLGLLQGELDFAVVDALVAADGAAQGLPVTALAGHRNYAADGTYRPDVVLVSTDLLDLAPSTVGSFLAAYVRGVRETRDDPDAAGYTPHDGGFGDRDQGGGFAELATYLTSALDSSADIESFVSVTPLEYAQALWGLSANPSTSSIAAAGLDAGEEVN